MLLPSPLPCDSARTQRPSSLSISTTARKMMRLSPAGPTCQPPTAPTANIYTACCALQSLLTTSLPLSAPTTARSVARPLDSPIHLSVPTRKPPKQKQQQKRYPSQGPPSQRKSLHPPPPSPAPSRKRRRETTPPPPTTTDHSDKENTPATPKRKRICPPSLPLGLGQEDFDALQAPAPPQPYTPFQLQPNTQFTTPSRPLPFPQPTMRPHRAQQEDEPPWTPTDDSALIGLILTKLQLRQSDWDETARKLGRGKASIGERFRMLLGEGEGQAPMRRGSGGWRRGSLEEMDFGGGGDC